MVNEAGLEALLGLRETIKGGKTPVEDGDSFILGDDHYEKTTITPFKTSGGDHYSLESLVFFITTKGKKSLGDYMKEAKKKRITAVKFNDRKDVESFLSGKIEWSNKIEGDKPSDMSKKKAKQQKKNDKEKEDGSKKKRKKDSNLTPEEKLYKKVKKREDTQNDRNTILQSSHRFTEALRIERDSKRAKEKQKKNKNNKSGGINAGGVSKNGTNSSGMSHNSRSKLGCPIIVVPAALSAPINLFNAKEFLENGKYLHTQEAREINPRKPQEDRITKRLGEHGTLQFKIVDSVKKFSNAHWPRVAAVITHGPEWQFKDWVWKDTATIFDKCRGLHVYFDDKKLPSHVQMWNVGKYPIKKQSRHQDAVAMHRIWQEIEQFLITRKPELLVSGKVNESTD